MDIVTYSETRANLKAIMDRVVKDHVPIATTRQRGRPVVMVDLDDWNALQETRSAASIIEPPLRLARHNVFPTLNEASRTQPS
jgi:prevent-host-death family protein